MMMDMQEKFHAAKITVGFNFQKISFRFLYVDAITTNGSCIYANTPNGQLKKLRLKKAIYHSPKTGETKGHRPCK